MLNPYPAFPTPCTRAPTGLMGGPVGASTAWKTRNLEPLHQRAPPRRKYRASSPPAKINYSPHPSLGDLSYYMQLLLPTFCRSLRCFAEQTRLICFSGIHHMCLWHIQPLFLTLKRIRLRLFGNSPVGFSHPGQEQQPFCFPAQEELRPEVERARNCARTKSAIPDSSAPSSVQAQTGSSSLRS